MYPVQSGVPCEPSVCADDRGRLALRHIPCSPSLHGHYPTSSLLGEHLTSAKGMAADLAMIPCQRVTRPGSLAWPWPSTDLLRSDVHPLYMPRSRTPVVPTLLPGPVLPSLLHTCSATTEKL